MDTSTSMFRKLMIVVCVGMFFSVGCVISDSAPYNPPLDLRSISWAGITVVNDISVWFLASVLIGWRLAKTKRQSFVIGAMFGFVAMAGYYALLSATTEVTYGWQHIALISIALIGGALAAFLGQIARKFPLLLIAPIFLLLSTIILRLSSGMDTGTSSVLAMVQIWILAVLAGIVFLQACYFSTKK